MLKGRPSGKKVKQRQSQGKENKEGLLPPQCSTCLPRPKGMIPGRNLEIQRWRKSSRNDKYLRIKNKTLHCTLSAEHASLNLSKSTSYLSKQSKTTLTLPEKFSTYVEVTHKQLLNKGRVKGSVLLHSTWSGKILILNRWLKIKYGYGNLEQPFSQESWLVTSEKQAVVFLKLSITWRSLKMQIA